MSTTPNIPTPSTPVEATDNLESTELETSEDTNNSTEETVETQEKPKEEVKKSLKKLKLKVDKQEYEEELPFDLPDDPAVVEYMTKQLQMAKMGSKRAQEYAKLEKDVRDFFEYLRSNPEEALSDPTVGIDVKQLAAKIIEKEIENSKKSPEQIEKEKLEAELKKMRDEREKEKKTAQEKEFERIQQQEYERYDTLMSQALEKSDLPKSPYIVKKMADYMLLGLQQGLDVNPSDVIPLVREEMQNDLKEMFAVMPDEVIEQLVGKDVITRIRKKSVQKAKQAVVPNKKVQDVAVKKEDSKPQKKMTFKDFFQV